MRCEISPSVKGSAVRVLAPDRARRGRPADPWLSAEEVAEILDKPLTRVRRVLDREEWRREFFPGARQRTNASDGTVEDWSIPMRDVRRLVGGSVSAPPALFSVPRFAGLMGWPVSTAWDRVRKGVVKSRKVLGERSVPVSEYFDLPERHVAVEDNPARVAVRLSFFARKSTVMNEEGLG